MNYLVDTHILIWSFTDPDKLQKRFRNELLNLENTIYYSQFSLWEISLKYSLGKLKLKKKTPEEFYKELSTSFFVCNCFFFYN